MQKSLTKTLDFQLDIHEGSQQLLHQGQLEARRVINEIFRLHRNGHSWDDVEDMVVARSNHVQNTVQRLVDKAQDVINRYYNEDEYGYPRQNHEESFPIRMNQDEGYDVQVADESDNIRFRVSALKYKHVKGVLNGSEQHEHLLQTALTDDEWRVGTAELVYRYGQYELHVNITHENAEVADKHDADTFIGVDINEDCIALAAVTNQQIEDAVIFEYPDVKKQRHEYFTIRKRMQSVGQTGFENTVQNHEHRFVHDQLHKISCAVVEWVAQFDSPVLVFEDLEDMRDDIDYGTRMNRRLHSLPFAQLRKFVSYKAAWRGIPSMDVDPAYTSQECLDCGHTSRSNRRGKRFQCVECDWQDHADRKAAVKISAKGLDELHGNVPALYTLPRLRVAVRRQCNGASEPPDHDPAASARSYQADGSAGSVSG